MELRAVRGMNDILPEEVARWHRAEDEFRRHVALYGFEEVRTPLIEHTSLFVRQVGETTDIVEKEMYSFKRHDEELSVRPEGTAGAARAYVEHHVHTKEPVSRWYYLGPMYRGERPAKGRYRQFYQAGVEVYGDPGPMVDAEVIELACRYLEKLGVSQYQVHLNSLGSMEARRRYKDLLVAFFTPKLSALSEDSQRRLARNPLRILDSKDPRDKEASQGAPKLLDAMGDDDKAHWESVAGYLDAVSIPHVRDDNLVRGLDYYTRTVFEIKTSLGDLGAQNTLCAGGRYDEMVEGLGGPKTPAIGFAMGIERLLTVASFEEKKARPAYFLAPLGAAAAARGMKIASDLRSAGLVVEIDGREASLKSKMRRASASGAASAVIFGDAELAKGVVQVKDLATGQQIEQPIAELEAKARR